ncbi:putative methyltransferase DDB_G0268948 [Lytechinus variegatus]|uniref:putative methyltransferase DDB_G0268948 n=1 Tax=Lytechinus variegatus TaxID=7654 RepID=UPI001BB2579B|nr:putative methyltransferase DDB_G0268948 [Lytechinus variegatus]
MSRFFEDKDVAINYLQYRPHYSTEVAETIVNYLAEYRKKPFETALDIGCGSGQLTRSLSPYFNDVLGVDISPAQIGVAKAAQNPQNVSFSVGKAEDLPVADSSLDLITSASASHYFDWSIFPKEVDRVLKPNGCLAVLGFHHLYIDHPNEAIRKKLDDCIESYFDYENNVHLKDYSPIQYQHTKDGYSTLQVPFDDQKCVNVELQYDISITDYIEFTKTYAVAVEFIKDNPGTSYFTDFKQSIMSILGAEEPDVTMVKSKMPAFVRLARKPDKH